MNFRVQLLVFFCTVMRGITAATNLNVILVSLVDNVIPSRRYGFYVTEQAYNMILEYLIQCYPEPFGHANVIHLAVHAVADEEDLCIAFLPTLMSQVGKYYFSHVSGPDFKSKTLLVNGGK